jgi:ABC-type branched-subunit amino acid transport system ATPase component/ABC-type branched-subunit amino acid transport system permease subunit
VTLAAFTIPGTGFELPLEVVVLGLITGLTYAVLGLGLALVYKTSRVINFAHGEMGALPAILIPILVVNQHWNYWAALALSLGTAATIGALFEFGIIRRLRNASRLTVLVATIGAAQVLFVIGILLPKGGELGAATYPTPFKATVTLGDLRLGAGQLLILIVVPAVTVWLTVFFRKGRLGRASRAAAENLEAAQTTGVPTQRVSQSMWVIAGLLAVTAAILVGPTRPITSQAALGPPLMVRALGAAMLGGLTNLPGVFAGGIAIGLIEALTIWNYPTAGTLEIVLFGVILVSLLVQRRLGQLARGAEESSWTLAGRLRALPSRLASHPRVRTARYGGLALLLVVASLLPVPFTTSQRFFMSGVLLFTLMGLSLLVLTGMAGQISLGQFAFVGLGAALGGRLIQLGYPHLPAAIIAVLIGGAVALVVGLPALRIRGLFLAVTTLALAVAAAEWMFDQSWLVNDAAGQTSLQIRRPVFLGVDFSGELSYYWLCLVVLVIVAAGVHRLRRTGVGRSFVAVRDNELSAAALSISPRRMKLLAFVLSGAIASLAGFLYGGLLVNFAYDPGTTFGPSESLALVVMAIFGGVTTITGVFLGAFWVRGIPYIFSADVGLLSSGFGLLAILLIIPGGLVSAAFWVRDRVVRWLVPEVVAPDEAPIAPAAPTPAISAQIVRTKAPTPVAHPDGAAPVVAEGISFWYGGVRALADVTIRAEAGEIVGLMGPNGAGKTTLFDVLSGNLRPAHGRVLLNATDVTALPPHRRARLGLGRTFQQSRLFDDLTVRDATALAMECHEPSQVVPSALGLPNSRRAERRKADRADELLDLLGLGTYADRLVSELPTGVRKTVELGCVAAMGARILLLDEPTAGFGLREAEAFGPVVRSIRDRLGATVVVIEHDVPMIMDLADRLYVLEAGRVIAEGPPRILEEDEAVLASYFGSEGKRPARRRRPVRRAPKRKGS